MNKNSSNKRKIQATGTIAQMVKGTHVVALAVAFVSHIFLEQSATTADSSDARGNPAAPIPCSQPSVV